MELGRWAALCATNVPDCCRTVAGRLHTYTQYSYTHSDTRSENVDDVRTAVAPMHACSRHTKP
eukprot:364228-Chlamydomonas_euryale.AAC.4